MTSQCYTDEIALATEVIGMEPIAQRLADLSPEQRALLLRRLQGKASQPNTGIPQLGATDAPLSFAQQRLWFLEQMQPGSDLFNIAMPIQIQGVYAIPQLLESLIPCLSTIVARHEALRTTFRAHDGVARQYISAPAPIALPVIDLTPCAPAERDAAMQQAIAAEARRPFDLSCDLLLRATLLRVGPAHHVLLLVAHHIAFDNWSVGVLMREMHAYFAAREAHQPLTLPPLPAQYADFAVWQRAWLQGPERERQLRYWRDQLRDVPAPLELPISRPRPAIRTTSGARQAFHVPSVTLAALRTLGQTQGVTLFMGLLAAWNVLLLRYTGRDDLIVGSPIANRTRSEVEPLIGFFVNTLPLRTSLAGNPTFRELLARVRSVTLGAHDHQELPFELLVDAVQPERSLSHTPLFQVVFALQNAPLPAGQQDTISLLPAVDGAAQFDLTLSMVEEHGGLRGALEYNTDLFTSDSIARLIGHFTTLLASLVAQPDQPIVQATMLTPAERHQLLVAWNATAAPYPDDQLAHALFAAQAQAQPDAVALRSGNVTLSYGVLEERANQLAHLLRARGVGPGTIVGVCGDKSFELIVGILGVLKAGGAFLPLDPGYPAERLAFMLDDAQVPLLLTQERHVARLPTHGAQVICLDRDDTLLDEQPRDMPPVSVTANDCAYVIYTSGSTGAPKGALLTHAGLVNFALDYATALGVTAESRVLQFFSFGFDGTLAEIFMALLRGATLCIAPHDVALAGPALLGVLRDYAITTTVLPPSMLAVLTPDDLPALHTIGSAGERCSHQIAAHWGRGRRFFNIYGATEATIASTLFRAQGDESAEAPLPVGRPMANTEIYVLDAQMAPVPIGVPGEIYIGGTGVGLGYLHRPELTRAKFVPHPFRAGARLYRTGDLGRLHQDGNLEFLDRADDQVKVRGFRIELGEIESALRQHPSVQEAVVVARPDGASNRLLAYLLATADAPASSDQLEPDALRRFLDQRLPSHMVPAAYFRIDTLPLTPNGKVDRKALAARPLPTRTTPTAPLRGLEQTIASIWQEVLELPSVGSDDTFFDLGGNSLSIVRVQSRLQQALGKDLTTLTLFQYPTVRALAAHLGQPAPAPAKTASDAQRAVQQRTALLRHQRRPQR